MAVGDAMGTPVEGKRYREICEAYGPQGLQGYDTANGLADISSYTQIALFACNGLLVSVTRGYMDVSKGMRHVVMALKEWARVQHFPRSPERRYCWVGRVPQLRRRKIMDARTLDALTRDVLGTPGKPANQSAGPGTLPAAVAVGLHFHPERMGFQEIGWMGAQVVALTHGDPLSFLSGAVLAYITAGLVYAPECSLEEQILQAGQTVKTQFSAVFPQAARLNMMLKEMVEQAKDPTLSHQKAMEQMECLTAAQALCGALYAVLVSGGNLDEAMITAVNHSGKSAAVAAIAGALLGLSQGEEALPEFYLESLEGADYIRELATDLSMAGPKGLRTRLFDDEWDRKYSQGLPTEH
jgi:ADP-ribosylglycohydrolase